MTSRRQLIFPPWFDKLVKLLGAGAGFGGVYVVLLVAFGFSPATTDVGYMPEQPIPYSHALHAGELGIDCRYCHNTVEHAAKAAIPPSQTCYNCHARIRKDSELLAPMRESLTSGRPIEWTRVHDLSDFAYFDHSAHITRGVSCVHCHGRVDRMEEVYQAKRLSMDFCLDCHRDPAPYLRPLDKVTDLDWEPDESWDPEAFMKERGLLDSDGNPTWRMRRLEDCSTCHR